LAILGPTSVQFQLPKLYRPATGYVNNELEVAADRSAEVDIVVAATVPRYHQHN